MIRNKLVDKILGIFFISLPLLIPGCYTVLDQSQYKERKEQQKVELPAVNSFSNELTGVWVRKELWVDYGYNYKRLEIYYDGRVIYIPESESRTSKVYYGSYSISYDTLIIKFEDKHTSEKMNYWLNADTLFTATLIGMEGTENNLINHCYSCIQRWIRNQ